MREKIFSKPRSFGEILRTVLFCVVFLVMAIYVLSMLTLLVWGLLNSLKTYINFKEDPIGLPRRFMFQNYAEAFAAWSVPIQGGGRIYIAEMLGNSLLYALGCSFFATLIPCIAAYATARFPYRFSKIVYVTVIIAMGLPVVGALPSEIQVTMTFGLFDSMVGAWILKANFLGMYYLVFHATFSSLSKDFVEAAQIDGAGNLRTFASIVLPVVKNAFFTIMLLKFIEFWNDYQTPMIYLPNHPTAALGMYFYSFSTDTNKAWEPHKIAGAMVLLLPVLAVFLCFHNRLIGNITMGGVKE